jgi:phosphoribosyl-ATP pyrophosphohydrolase/phosphoribosyl-AMP cyclohydrolase/histidinol dehydrogenase
MIEPLLRVLSVQDLPRLRRRPFDAATLDAAAAILRDIESRGNQAVLEHAVRFGDTTEGSRYLHDPDALRAALNRLPGDQRAVLERTADRISQFAHAQKTCLTGLDTAVEGGRAGHMLVPVQTAGCYAPGGRSPLPSSVLMTAITARVAGVPTVWVASPRPTEATLAAAAIAGADGLLGFGGVQAIGAMAMGLCGLPPCDMIVGPGNRWVTAAKFLVSDRTGIDMLAGPSELVVLADESADPAVVAADLLAQAEHDDDALPVLVSLDPSLPARVERHLRSMLGSLPTRATAAASLRNGFAVVVPHLEAALDVCDALAPEHLEIMTGDAPDVASRVRHAGALFVGVASGEVLGDYGAGPNHVLPTGGTARFKSGLSVLSFLRARTWLRIDDPGSGRLARRDAQELARMETLEAHARAAALR